MTEQQIRGILESVPFGTCVCITADGHTVKSTQRTRTGWKSLSDDHEESTDSLVAWYAGPHIEKGRDTSVEVYIDIG